MERDDWDEVELDKIADTYNERFDPQKNENRLYLGLKHIGQGTLRIEEVGDSKDTKSSKKIFHSGDILFGRLRPYFRKIVQPDFNGVCSGEFIIIKGNDSVNQKFLFYRLADENLVDRITKTCGGVERPRAKWSVINDLKIKIPSLPTQKKIATILSNYDDLIENNNQRIEILEEIAKLIYREWFVNFRFPGHEDVEMVYNEELDKEIPEGWQVTPMSSAVEIDPKISVPEYKKKPYVPMKYVPPNTMVIDDYEMRKGNKGSTFQNGDTLMARITPSIEHGKTAFVQFLSSDEDVANGSTEFYVLRSKTLNPYFVYCLARNETLRKYAINTMVGASGRQRVQKEVFNLFKIAHPPADLLNKFEEYVSPIFRLIHNLWMKNRLLENKRDMLLQRLVTGHIDVSDLDIEISDTVVEAEA